MKREKNFIHILLLDNLIKTFERLLTIRPGVELAGAYLPEANLRGVNLRWAKLLSACLSEADIRKADLRGANLALADIEEADFRGADLRGTDFQVWPFHNVKFQGALYNNETKFPKGFDPVKAGMVKIEE